jgi:hypothetical protein
MQLLMFHKEHFLLRQRMTLTTKIYCWQLYLPFGVGVVLYSSVERLGANKKYQKKKKRGARGLFIQTKRQIGRWVQSINVDNFETFQDITHVGDSTCLLNYINRCENLRIGPLLFYTASQARRNLRTILLVHTRNHFIPRCSGLDLVVRY